MKIILRNLIIFLVSRAIARSNPPFLVYDALISLWQQEAHWSFGTKNEPGVREHRFASAPPSLYDVGRVAFLSVRIDYRRKVH